jgi:Na+/proline symporter
MNRELEDLASADAEHGQMESSPLLSTSAVAAAPSQTPREKAFTYLIAVEVGALAISMIFNGMSWSFYADAVRDLSHHHDSHDIQEALSRAKFGCWFSTLILLVLFATIMTSLACRHFYPEPENTADSPRLRR